MEMWDAINGTWLELKRYGNGPTSREELSRFLRWVQESSLRFDGSAYRTMLRNDAYWFSRLGVYIERADNTARILDVKYHLLLPDNERVGGPLDYFQWAAILRSVSALTAYHWVYRDSLKPWLVADLLILKRRNAALAASCYEAIVRNLDQIARRLWPSGPGAAAGARHAHPPAKQPHGRHFPARTARIHQRIHHREQPARRRHHRTVPDMSPRVATARASLSSTSRAQGASDAHADPHLPRDHLPLRHAADRRDAGAAPDAAQSRRPVRGRLAHRPVARTASCISTKTPSAISPMSSRPRGRSTNCR